MTTKFKAFSPTGKPVKDTFECTSGTHGIAYFIKDDDSFVHELSDAYSTYDQETVIIDGEVAFVDTDWKVWPFSALTFKDDSGEIVHQGKDVPPLDIPDFDMALTLGLQARKLAGGTPALVEQDWIDTADAQAWDEASQVIHLEGFIRSMGLMPFFAAYAVQVAKEENADAPAA